MSAAPGLAPPKSKGPALRPGRFRPAFGPVPMVRILREAPLFAEHMSSCIHFETDRCLTLREGTAIRFRQVGDPDTTGTHGHPAAFRLAHQDEGTQGRPNGKS